MAKRKNPVWLVLLGILALVALWLVMSYNKLIKKEEQVKFQWNEVENAYQRRLQLIPNLVNIVKGGAEYESETLEAVTRARANAAQINLNQVNAENYNAMIAVQDELAQAANRLIISVERYPQIQGTRAFRDLQTQLEGTERRIKVARKDFNDAVMDYNGAVRTFPTNLAAGVLGFSAREGFTADAGAENRVEIKF